MKLNKTKINFSVVIFLGSEVYEHPAFLSFSFALEIFKGSVRKK